MEHRPQPIAANLYPDPHATRGMTPVFGWLTGFAVIVVFGALIATMTGDPGQQSAGLHDVAISARAQVR